MHIDLSRLLWGIMFVFGSWALVSFAYWAPYLLVRAYVRKKFTRPGKILLIVKAVALIVFLGYSVLSDSPWRHWLFSLEGLLTVVVILGIPVVIGISGGLTDNLDPESRKD